MLPSAARVYTATGGGGNDIEATRSVASYILAKHKTRVLASDLTRNVRVCRGQTLKQVQDLVSPLVAGGWLIPEDIHFTSMWAVDPGVHAEFAAQTPRATTGDRSTNKGGN